MSGFGLRDVPLLARVGLERAEELRSDWAALQAGWASARLLRMNRRGQVWVAGGALVLHAATTLADEPDTRAVFLGVHGGRHVWAVRDETIGTHTHSPGRLLDLRGVGELMAHDAVSLGMVTTAIALLNWHDRAGFSARDGSATTVARAGWSRFDAAGEEEFPRIDPAMICLIHDGGQQVLLGRQHHWPQDRYSLLAGFVEAGESLEQCVRREIYEEVGVRVRDIEYLGSQPWPMPRSLMVGFAAVADPAAPLRFTDNEIAEARWFTRAQVQAALASGSWTTGGATAGGEPQAAAGQETHFLLLPPPISIARTIIESWAAQEVSSGPREPA